MPRKVDKRTVMMKLALEQPHQERMTVAEDLLHSLQGVGIGPDINAYNMMIAGYAKNAETTLAHTHFAQLQQTLKPNAYSIISILWATALNRPHDAELALAHFEEQGFVPGRKTALALLSGYAAKGDFRSAEVWLDQMYDCKVNDHILLEQAMEIEAKNDAPTMSWVNILSGKGELEDLSIIFDSAVAEPQPKPKVEVQPQQVETKLDNESLIRALATLIEQSRHYNLHSLAEDYLAEAERLNERSSKLSAAVLAAFPEDLQRCRRYFESVADSADADLYNAFIDVLLYHAQSEEALDCAYEMLEKQMLPSERVLSKLIEAASQHDNALMLELWEIVRITGARVSCNAADKYILNVPQRYQRQAIRDLRFACLDCHLLTFARAISKFSV